MKFKELDTIVLSRDLVEHGLERGDLGAVVAVLEPDELEVEFVMASGRTVAVLTVREEDVRRVDDTDLVTVRSFTAVK
ncbi:MAG: DUF4926 domain-containing protein [Candidatus Eisenbacteria bacterium]|nr:DUF4926 domain-containing protein [Candidatus Eisenbacteria bacterium]